MPRLYTPKPHSYEPAHAIWVIAADAGRARIFQASQTDGRIDELDDLVNPEARLQDHEAVSDRRGHVTQGAAGLGHAFEPRQSHEDHVAESFARTLCRRLEQARHNGEVGRIYLLADPTLIGLLRKHLDAPTRRLVVMEATTDVSRRTVDEIRGLLPETL